MDFLHIVNIEEQPIRYFECDSKLWFIANDVCSAFNYADNSNINAVKNLRDSCTKKLSEFSSQWRRLRELSRNDGSAQASIPCINRLGVIALAENYESMKLGEYPVKTVIKLLLDASEEMMKLKNYDIEDLKEQIAEKDKQLETWWIERTPK